MATKTKPAAPSELLLLIPVGVYLNEHRESALVVQSKTNCVWFLSMHTGKVEIHTAGPERFARDYPITLSDYPLRRAVRVYATSEFSRDERTQKVMERLLEDRRNAD